MFDVERAIAAARPFLPAAFNAAGARHISFGSHCSESEVQKLVAQAGNSQVVIGVGGGALLDTVKAVARRLNVPVVVIPTIAATCAAWTPLSVWYNDAGQALRFEIFNDANHLVLVEPEIILRAPQGIYRIETSVAVNGKPANTRINNVQLVKVFS